jgi:hypothetical protein
VPELSRRSWAGLGRRTTESATAGSHGDADRDRGAAADAGIAVAAVVAVGIAVVVVADDAHPACHHGHPKTNATAIRSSYRS